MVMSQAEAERVKGEIERINPELQCQVRQYEQAWMVIVTNPRTNEEIGISSANDWQPRLDTLMGGAGYPKTDGREM